MIRTVILFWIMVAAICCANHLERIADTLDKATQATSQRFP